jgi:hypothetical protein
MTEVSGSCVCAQTGYIDNGSACVAKCGSGYNYNPCTRKCDPIRDTSSGYVYLTSSSGKASTVNRVKPLARPCAVLLDRRRWALQEYALTTERRIPMALATIRPPRLVVDLSPAESGWIKSPSPLPPSSAWKPTATTSSALPVSPHAPSPVVERANTNGSTRSTISSLAVGARAWARVRIVPPSRARGGWDATWAIVRSTRAGVGSERLAGTRASRCRVDLGAWRAVGHQDIISLYLDMMDFISPGRGLSSPSAAPRLTKLCGEKLLRSSLLPKSVIRDNTLASSRFSSRYS